MMAHDVATLLLDRGFTGTRGMCVLAMALGIFIEAHEGSKVDLLDQVVFSHRAFQHSRESRVPAVRPDRITSWGRPPWRARPRTLAAGFGDRTSPPPPA